MALEPRSRHGCYGGVVEFHAQPSRETKTEIRFAIFLPPQARREKVFALYYLAGLTCTEETFMMKAGAQRLASELGLALVTCDTSPRGLGLAGETDSWDFGAGAGFYLDATQAPWSTNYRMGSYVARELPELIEASFPVRSDRRGIFGHSMGGHGALVTALRDPDRWHSVSAFAPIANPSLVPWGEKAFGNYLGPDRKAWAAYDACELLKTRRLSCPLLVDQGLADPFLAPQLHVETLRAAAEDADQPIELRLHEGYDHGYYFISTFMDEHLRHHRKILAG